MILAETKPTLDARYQRTHAAMLKAVTEILRDSETSDTLSVSEIVKLAGVSRPTFYQHFGDVRSAVRESALARLEEIFASLTPVSFAENWQRDLATSTAYFISRIATDADFFITAISGQAGRGIEHDLVQFIAGRIRGASPITGFVSPSGTTVSAEEYSEFLAAGASWHVLKWLLNQRDAAGQRLSPAQVAEQVIATLDKTIAASAA